MNNKFLVIFISSFIFMNDIYSQSVKVEQDGTTITLSNGTVTVEFDKSNADRKKIIYKGKSLLNGKDQHHV